MSDFTYISFGAGVQSTALLVCSALGLHNVPKADVAIFADTGDEPGWVYDHLAVMIPWAAEHGIPIHVASQGHLSQDIIDRHNGSRSRFAAIPVYTVREHREGMLRRQCTREYKIQPIERKVRELMGYAKGQRVRHSVTAMIGISLDEVTRMRDSRTRWVTNTYPLINAGLRRGDCMRIADENGLGVPKKSSCIFCPYHSDAFYRDLKQNHPDEFARAVEIDRAVRDMSMSGVEQPVFIHRSCLPLDQVDFNEDQMDLFDNECEGYCGV